MKKLFALVLCASIAGCATAPTATTDSAAPAALLAETQAAPAADAAAVPEAVATEAVATEAVAAPAAGATPAAEAAPAAGQVVGDIATQCAKKYAMLKGCDRLGLGAGICRKGVEKKYSSLACALVR